MRGEWVSMPVPLTHRLLSELVAARRPSVTTAPSCPLLHAGTRAAAARRSRLARARAQPLGAPRTPGRERQPRAAPL